MLTYLRFTVLLSSAILVLGCASSARDELPRTPRGSEQAEYRILRGDQLDIRFYDDEQLDELALVRTDGRISLQLVGDVDAADSTPAELAFALEARFEEFLDVPRVAVSVLESAQRVDQLGRDAKPVARDSHAALEHG